MKKLIYGGLLLALVGLMFVGCNKDVVEDTSYVVPVLSGNANKSAVNFNVENNLNPYDSLGLKHNEMVVSFLNDVFFESNPYEIGENDVYDYFEASFEDRIRYANVDYKSSVSFNEYEGRLSDYQNIHPELFDVYYSITSVIYDNQSSMNQKINKIKEIEKSIIDNSNPIFSVNNDLTIDQIELLILSSTSVARHSLFLWSSKKEGGLGYYDIVSPPNSAKGPPNWVVDDIWGTYTSALFTWNPWTALAGGAASSVVSAIREYWE